MELYLYFHTARRLSRTFVVLLLLRSFVFSLKHGMMDIERARFGILFAGKTLARKLSKQKYCHNLCTVMFDLEKPLSNHLPSFINFP